MGISIKCAQGIVWTPYWDALKPRVSAKSRRGNCFIKQSTNLFQFLIRFDLTRSGENLHAQIRSGMRCTTKTYLPHSSEQLQTRAAHRPLAGGHTQHWAARSRRSRNLSVAATCNARGVLRGWCAVSWNPDSSVSSRCLERFRSSPLHGEQASKGTEQRKQRSDKKRIWRHWRAVPWPSTPESASWL